ncbi:PhzF family phenazine biosynthesis protein [Rhizomonospora bruguierae]|uniref:PhzF family phenazine biosynthesis protein n=1 Tax=Rhizomonospora bruguierae TaxID=1581705 RepID=UPI001BD10B0F|nr:PhzF family phenazine biosynthesis protein [Micromonospora sp. NBRC 107566]
MATLRFEIVDVFTDRPFTGNPLAVVFGAEELAGAQMQALTREFNLSETVFVLPPTPGTGATYRARIFTPERELPFAGHPSVGAAATVVRRGLAPAGTVVQECGAGLLPIAAGAGHATLTGGEPTLGPELDPVPLLTTVGLKEEDLAGPVPRMAGCGLEWPYLLVNPDAVARAAGDSAAARATGLEHILVFAWSPTTRTAHARAFCPGLGVPEDPGTGSAALGLGVYLVGTGLLPGHGTSSYTVHQGAEIHRPSVLEATVAASGGTATGATVAGNVVPVAAGEITVPPFVG